MHINEISAKIDVNEKNQWMKPKKLIGKMCDTLKNYIIWKMFAWNILQD